MSESATKEIFFLSIGIRLPNAIGIARLVNVLNMVSCVFLLWLVLWDD